MCSDHSRTNSTPDRSTRICLSLPSPARAKNATLPFDSSINRLSEIGPPVKYLARYFSTCSGELVSLGGPSIYTTQSRSTKFEIILLKSSMSTISSLPLFTSLSIPPKNLSRNRQPSRLLSTKNGTGLSCIAPLVILHGTQVEPSSDGAAPGTKAWTCG